MPEVIRYCPFSKPLKSTGGITSARLPSAEIFGFGREINSGRVKKPEK
jgi:hypothetical protein